MRNFANMYFRTLLLSQGDCLLCVILVINLKDRHLRHLRFCESYYNRY